MLIYIPRLTNRLGYTLNVVFSHILHIGFSITLDKKYFEEYTGPKLCYADEAIGNEPFIKAHKLLFKTTIEEQELKPFCYEGVTALFPTFGKNLTLPFDIFAATFYLISRYEEYLPHHIDAHGRFLATESVAFKHGFLQVPVIDHWALMLHKKLSQSFPELPSPTRSFSSVITIDIDAAYCYLHKGIFRSTIGLLRDGLSHHNSKEVRQRINVLLHKEPDPYDTFDFIIDVKKQHPFIKLLFFPLLGDYGVYDKPASYNNKHFRELLQHLSDYAKIGIHSSYSTLEKPQLIKKETQRLSDILHRPIVRNRFHFLRLQLPTSYRHLVSENIPHDYSMGYAEEPGFRSGTASPHPFYDIERDEESSLTIHPFSVMDTTLFKYKKMSATEALSQFQSLIDECKKVDAPFCAIWHNQNLCDDFGWEGWRTAFEHAVDYAARLLPSSPKTSNTQSQQ